MARMPLKLRSGGEQVVVPEVGSGFSVLSEASVRRAPQRGVATRCANFTHEQVTPRATTSLILTQKLSLHKLSYSLLL